MNYGQFMFKNEMGVAGLFFKPGPYKFERLDILERKKMIFFSKYFRNFAQTRQKRSAVKSGIV